MSTTTVKGSSEYGWLVIKRDEYERMVAHDYAGPEDGGTVWVLAMDEVGATCLYKGVTIEDSVAVL